MLIITILRQKPISFYLLLLLFFSFFSGVKASVRTFEPNPQKIRSRTGSFASNKTLLDSLNKMFVVEKLFIQTDKDFYAANDTIWFKAYLFDSKTNAYSKFSSLLYLELISDDAKLIKRVCVPVGMGLGWGQIALAKDNFADGYYTLRAYTNYMQNYPEECFFRKGIYVANTESVEWLINETHKIETVSGHETLKLSVGVKDLNSNLLKDGTIDWVLSSNKQIVAKKQILQSKIDEVITLPEKLKEPLVLTLSSKNDPAKRLVVPLQNPDMDGLDLQFMPEGGHFVAGITSNVGFKAIGRDGLGKVVEGVIKDSKKNVVTAFRTAYNGMGNVEITPLEKEKYIAEVTLANGKKVSFNLPEIRISGSVIRLINNPNDAFIRAYVFFSPDLLNGSTYTLVGFSRGCAFYKASFESKARLNLTIPKDKFPSGIAHFTLFNEDDKPLNERITFINNHDIKSDVVISGLSSHTAADSIPLNLKTFDIAAASLSVSVTDDKQVKADSLNNNILSSVYLSSELKGNIESPGYYFLEKAASTKAMELLMLTQGWKCYEWDEVLKPVEKPRFLPETSFKISGRVLNVLNKPVSQSKVVLMGSGKGFLLKDTITNELGQFEFQNFPPLDSMSFVVQARNQRGKSFNVGIEKNEFAPAAIVTSLRNVALPWYLSDTSSSVNMVRSMRLKEKMEQQKLLDGSQMLQSVTVVARKAIKGSQNLNGAGAADKVIEEASIRKQADKSLLQFMLENIEGLHAQSANTSNPKVYYYLHERKVKFVIDGMDVDFSYSGEPNDVHDYLNFIKSTVGEISASEVKGIEIMHSPRYTSRYDLRFAEAPAAMMNVKSFTAANNNAYIEITTRSGKGLTMRPTLGVAVYRPVPLTWPAKFYSPRYQPAPSPNKLSDFRSTIHWEPNVVTSAEGRAQVSFFVPNREGTYTVTIQGTDMNGKMLFKMEKFKVDDLKK